MMLNYLKNVIVVTVVLPACSDLKTPLMASKSTTAWRWTYSCCDGEKTCNKLQSVYLMLL